MTPLVIHEIITKEFPQLVPVKRSNPVGWSYYFGVKQVGTKSSRILRSVAKSPNMDASIKLSVSSRLRESAEFVFTDSKLQLIELIKKEIQLYQ